MNDKPIRVLVTRPREQSSKLCALLRNQGYHAICLPLIEVVSDDNHVLDSIDQFDIVIFTSRNAVRFASENGLFSGLLGSHDLMTIAAIGSATQSELRKLGIKKIITGNKNFTSEGLLEQLVFSTVENNSILIVKGRGGRKYLADSLEKRGARVTKADVYQRKCIDYGQEKLIKLGGNEFDVAFITSTEILERYLELLDPLQPQLRNIPLIVGSQRIYQQAIKNGCKELFCAENPTDTAMTEVLQREFAPQ